MGVFKVWMCGYIFFLCINLSFIAFVYAHVGTVAAVHGNYIKRLGRRRPRRLECVESEGRESPPSATSQPLPPAALFTVPFLF